MSPRPRATFNKLQKERARQEKQRTKAERKQQRKAENEAAAARPEHEEGIANLENNPEPSGLSLEGEPQNDAKATPF